MHAIDIAIFVIYFCILLAVGVYFSFRNQTMEDFFVGGRKMSSLHIGFSVAATDVGGGFTIGLGGLGFSIGLSGSWLLFTGLLGSWVSAVLLIPRIKKLEKTKNYLTYPEVIFDFYGSQPARIAALLTVVGYLGFTSSQIMAGGKLAAATLPEISFTQALLAMGIVSVVYTALGGIKAVIYTDTVQWLVVLFGLAFLAIPLGYVKLGGYEAIRAVLPADHLSFFAISWSTFFNWLITIFPIWFVAMTLYQRIFASRDCKSAQRAWYLAGLMEWPVIALIGVTLGVFARVAFMQGALEPLGYAANASLDAELGLPLFIKLVLPAGLLGIVLAAYFSAVLSTADSCLMAATGVAMRDLLPRFLGQVTIKQSQFVTCFLGAIAIFIALHFENVLRLMLLSYSVMISGLFVPSVAMLFLKKHRVSSHIVALSMLLGGAVTITLQLAQTKPLLGLDPAFYGIIASTLLFSFGLWAIPPKKQ